MSKNTFIFIALFCTSIGAHASEKVDKAQVLNHYANIAYATFNDSLISAKALHRDLVKLLEKPTSSNLEKAKESWKNARIPYQQTEVYRFGNAIVDEWEGKVNAWPLDEGLIDYVAASYGVESEDNPLYTANVIANPKFELSNRKIDASKITKTLLTETLHEIDGVEANVATGYHAIEFLLWGQDLNGTSKGAGNRPVSDFDVDNCTAGNCDRRGQYLLMASELLIDDLEWMLSQWTDSGPARLSLLKDENAGLNSIIVGMGSLSYGELAGERIKLGVLLHDPEEEHDCFSDNTHNSHFFNIQGIQNVYRGRYKNLSGPSLSELVEVADKKVSAELDQSILKSLAAAQVLVESAETEGVAYDQLLAENNTAGNAKINAVVDALLQQTKSIESAAKALGLTSANFEGSDSLDSPNAVFE